MDRNSLRRDFRQRASSPATGRRCKNFGRNARQNYLRYIALAREAASVGDTVQMENWYQHAEHYFRVMDDRH
jgi:hypothetical protein